MSQGLSFFQAANQWNPVSALSAVSCALVCAVVPWSLRRAKTSVGLQGCRCASYALIEVTVAGSCGVLLQWEG